MLSGCHVLPEPMKLAGCIMPSTGGTHAPRSFTSMPTMRRLNGFWERDSSNTTFSLFSYQLMPNHWHLVLRPNQAGEMSHFLRWMTATHTMRYHAHYHTSGEGNVYQGRFKSFAIQDDDHFLTVCRYVERNACRANLVARAEDWRWGSLWRWRFKPWIAGYQQSLVGAVTAEQMPHSPARAAHS